MLYDTWFLKFMFKVLLPRKIPGSMSFNNLRGAIWH